MSETIYDVSLADRMREIAAVVDAAPDFADTSLTCNAYSTGAEVAFHNLSRDELVELRRFIGGKVFKSATGTTFWISGERDGITVTGFARDREEVCERVVTGTRIVPATEEHEEELVEWKCDPLLSGDDD